MVRRRRSDGGSFFYERISEACGWCVGSHNASGDDFAYESVPDIGWPWVPAAYDVEVDIVALGLTGQETAADLQRLAEGRLHAAGVRAGDSSERAAELLAAEVDHAD